MRKHSVIFLIALMFLLASNLFAQISEGYLESTVIALFDEQQEVDFRGDTFSWTVRANGGSVVARTETGDLTDPDPVFELFEAFPQALYNRNNPPPPDPRVLGVRAEFLNTGFNFLEFIPVYPNEPGKGIPIPGIARSLSVWVWGSNYNFYIEAHFRDYRGIDHVLRLGDTLYRGWQNLQVDIPVVIPQRGAQGTTERRLELTKLVLWTTPGERVDGFSVYLDEIKTATNIFSEPYDGDELANPDNAGTVDALWQQQRGN